VPDFGDKMAACMVDRVRAKGGSAQEVDATKQQMATFKQLFDNPVLNPLLTFAESFQSVSSPPPSPRRSCASADAPAARA
jgi:hypothetical protein